MAAAEAAIELMMRDLAALNFSDPGSRIAVRVRIGVGVGVGATTIGEVHSLSVDDLMRCAGFMCRADLMLHEAKNTGRDRIIAKPNGGLTAAV